MKSKFLTIFAAIGISTFSIGCAHYHKIEGREEKSEIPEGVRVNIGSSEVKAGDSVDVFKRKCVKNKKSISHREDDHDEETCTITKLGEAVVTKVLTSDVAIVSPQSGLTMEPDMYVEKSK